MEFKFMASWNYFHTLDPFLIAFTENLGIRWYSLAYLLGFFMSYILIKHWLIKTKTTALTEKTLMDFIVYVACGVVLGGRLGYALFYSPSLLVEFNSDFPFWELLKIYKGGLSSHGGIFGLTLATFLFAKKQNIAFFHCLDLTVLGASFGIFFGRLANFVNGELFGRVIQSYAPLAVQFPQEMLLWLSQKNTQSLHALKQAVSSLKNTNPNPQQWEDLIHQFEATGAGHYQIYQVLSSLIKACEKGQQAVIHALSAVLSHRHPSQIYQALLEGLIPFVLVVWVWRAKPRKAGLVASLWMLAYALMRIVGEQFRMPDSQLGFRALGLTRGQWLSVFMLLWVGLCFILVWKNKNPKKWGGWKNTP